MKSLYIALALSVSTPALAADYMASPVASPEDTISYFKGAASVERATSFGTIRVTAIGEETGKPAFVVEITNTSGGPINIGTENMYASFAGQKKPTTVYSAADIQRMVESKAAWAAALTGLSAALSSNTSTARACGYNGCYTATVTTPNYYAQANASRKIDAIYENSALRVDELKANYLQMTTVQPGQSYGGRVALSKPKVKTWPARLTLTIIGQDFTFDVRK